MSYVLPAEHRPGSDSRIREAAHALSKDLRGPWPYLRELQWTQPSAGGLVFVTPPCYREPNGKAARGKT